MNQPAWFVKAQALERQGQFKEMEQCVRDAVPHLAFARVIAGLYSDRMLRLRDAGDPAGAKAAFDEAESWIYMYAGMATSGGEGAALSLERDDFLKELKALIRRT